MLKRFIGELFTANFSITESFKKNGIARYVLTWDVLISIGLFLISYYGLGLNQIPTEQLNRYIFFILLGIALVARTVCVIIKMITDKNKS